MTLPSQDIAHFAVTKAVKNGTLVPQKCELRSDGTCSGIVVAHHDDYTKPLDVRWLCTRHHRRHHVANGRALGWEKPGPSRIGAILQKRHVNLALSAERLRAVRIESGMTERDFADKLGIALARLRGLETGRRVVQPREAVAYSNLTRQPPSYFYPSPSSEGTTP